ncbi:tRNA wybutosine-synthesizing protein 2 homolog isoform X1 [Harpia harpyja]|uniref:tRNA wybutosine-synthesizing protein 2 homolog isoform X1 n=1 Tax=Harpia harpyja TaxID=202280 RepID=UPI0022B1287F|nr:tRNA wybutosine-synthesizing protein 2 homolog isoform X1 [Harpia harpyja]XP_052669565.1 tRNA wybutosine-synthesizing protein 2 homolog isoform X1 [Harpia harpyja]XP_052669566.1 tRNA wybutosine-synthesizing protein 2 homolog isoform X1 [Harpia harpyja]
MEARDVPIPVPALATEPRFAQRLREHLEEEQLLDGRYRLQEVPGGHVALPVVEEKLSQLRLPQEIPCGLVQIQDPVPSRAARRQTPAQKLRDELRQLLGKSWSEKLERDVPRAWQRHGDLVLLSEDCFRAAPWEKLGKGEQGLPAQILPAELSWLFPKLRGRVRCRSSTLGDGRLSSGCLSAGQARTGVAGWDAVPQCHPAAGPGWLGGARGQRDQVGRSHGAGRSRCREGAALIGPVISPRYTFDVTKCMFSPGNITEKLRVASLPCSGEVLVDLYAGIGYFTLPYLVHAAAAFAHACEWNGHAVEALRRNLALNGVQDRCHIHYGDSRQLELQDVADRVNLGLIPSSEEGWPVACRVLKKGTGGVLHIHHNVETVPSPAPPQTAVLQAEQGSLEGAGSDGEVQHPAEDGGKETLAARIRPEWQRWAEATAARIRGLLVELHGQPWRTSILHIEAVKSYAPHVHHLVLDLECRPMLPT